MSILKAVLSPFVDFEDQPGQVPTGSPATSVPVTGANVAVNSPSQSTIHVDDAMVEQLEKTVLQRKTPYTALLEASNKLIGVIPDESTRVKAAFAMVTNEGARTIKNIVDAIDVHIADIEGENLRFKKASSEQITVRCSSLRDKADKLAKQIQNNKERINSLTQEINQLNETCEKAQMEVIESQNMANKAEQEIADVQQKFADAVEFSKQKLITKKSDLTRVLN